MAEPILANMAEDPEARIPPEPQLETESIVIDTQPPEQTITTPFDPQTSQTQGLVGADEQIEQSDMYLSGATVLYPLQFFFC